MATSVKKWAKTDPQKEEQIPPTPTQQVDEEHTQKVDDARTGTYLSSQATAALIGMSERRQAENLVELKASIHNQQKKTEANLEQIRSTITEGSAGLKHTIDTDRQETKDAIQGIAAALRGLIEQTGQSTAHTEKLASSVQALTERVEQMDRPASARSHSSQSSRASNASQLSEATRAQLAAVMTEQANMASRFENLAKLVEKLGPKNSARSQTAPKQNVPPLNLRREQEQEPVSPGSETGGNGEPQKMANETQHGMQPTGGEQNNAKCQTAADFCA